MANFNSKKIKPLLTPNWTTRDNKSEPFYQPASGSSAERYSITVLSKWSTTGGPQLQSRMDACKEPGLSRILKFYSKTPSGSISDYVFTEDYYIPERPKAKMKVLVSLPCTYLESLPEQGSQSQLENLGPPTAEINLNTYDLETKIGIASNFLSKYSAEIKQFYGRVYDIDFKLEMSRLKSFLPALTTFLRENEIVYSSANSDLVTLYINDDYKVLTTKINQGKGYVDLIKGYNNFIENPSVNNDRTIFILSKLDEMEKMSVLNKQVSWSKFLKDYIYRPPSIDFSKPPPRSFVLSSKVAKTIEKDSKKHAQTLGEIKAMRSYLLEPAVREELQKQMDEAHSFVGDTVLANLDELSSLMKDMQAIYDNFFNKLGIDGLINSAVQCLNLPELGIFSIPTEILDTLTAAAKAIQAMFNPPTMGFPSNFPVVDFMGDMIMKMLLGILDAMISMLIQLIIEIIKSLFDFCNECAAIDAEGNKTFSALSYGSTSFLGLVGGAFSAGFEANMIRLPLSALYSSMQETSDGNVELLSQQVLKNQIKNREHIYKLEAEEIHAKYQSGELAKPHRLALDKKIEDMFGMQWTVERGNFLNLKGKKVQELFGSTDVTVERIKILLESEEPWETEVFRNAAEEVAEYLEMSSTVLNPGEIGNALLGCNVGDEAKEAMRNTLPDFPNIYKLLAGETDEETDNNIAGLWSGFSNIIPQKAFLKEIADAVELTPEKFQCLCDADDEALRNDLLKKKDPQMTPEQRRDQVKKSKDRKRDRLKEMTDMMGKDDILAGMIPPLVCSGSYDDEGNPVIEPGILPVSHPVTQFMIKQTLDTIYDPLHITFTRDLEGLLPAMSQKPLLKRVVPRTVTAEIDGDEIRVFNMEFLDLVGKGGVAFGSLPDGAIVPGSKRPPDDEFDPEDPEAGGYAGDEIWEYNQWMAALGFDAFRNPQGAGMWEAGQSKPTPEQEYEWEKKNVTLTQSYNEEGDFKGHKVWGGRRFDKTIVPGNILGFKWNEAQVLGWTGPEKGNGTDAAAAATVNDYAKAFGYSPIPVETYSFGALTFAPGLKESYNNMCEGFKLITPQTEVGSKTFTIKDRSNSTDYKFKMPNIMNSFGLEFDQMAQGLARVGGDIMKTMGGSGQPMEVDATVLQTVANQLEALQASSFNFIYNVKHDDPSVTDRIGPRDTFSLDFQIVPGTNAPVKGAKILTEEIGMSGPPSSVAINSQAEKIIEAKTLEVVLNPTTNASVQPQEGYFYDFAKNSWLNGNTIYRNGEAVASDDIPGSLKAGVLNGGNVNSFVSFLYNDTAYKNLFGDLFCAFTTQVSDSPYLNLQPDDKGRGLLNLNLNPSKIVGNAPLCYRTLLDVDLIKQRVTEEYEYIECFREAFNWSEGSVDTTGLTGNKDTAFEISNRAGCILLTIRLYVLEFLLRSVYTFHYFVLGQGAEADATSVYYLYHQIIEGIASRSIGTPYYDEFQRETVELYNRNNKTNRLYDENKKLRFNAEANPKYTDFKKALEYFIRNQLYSVSRRLSKHVRIKGDGSPHSILLEKWLPTVEPPKFKGDPRFAEHFTQPGGSISLRNKPLGTYMEATGIPEITPEILSSVQREGTLSEQRIAAISALPGAKGEPPVWGMLYQKATGAFFKEYFALNLQIPAAENLLKPYANRSEMVKKAVQLTEGLWPKGVNWTGNSWIKVGCPTLGMNYSFREARLLGYRRPPYAGIRDQSDNCRGALHGPKVGGGFQVHGPLRFTSHTEQFGQLGQVGFPWNTAANLGDKYPATYPNRQPITPEKTIDNGAFPFGVSLAEKEAMIGNGGADIPGGLIRFIEAAKNWTMGLMNNRAGNLPWSAGDSGIRGTPRTPVGYEPGKYAVYEPNHSPWWWQPLWQQPNEIPQNNTNRINYLQSSKFYGPGSLLWAMSRERPPSDDAFGMSQTWFKKDWQQKIKRGNKGIPAHGVGAFGIVNDCLRMNQRHDLLPDEFKEKVIGGWSNQRREKEGQWFISRALGSTGGVEDGKGGWPHRIPFLVDWHNYVLGKPTHPDVKAALDDPEQENPINYYNSTNSEITKNVEITLRFVETGLMPYISLLDLDTYTLKRTLEWEQIQYRNMIWDMDIVIHGRHPGGEAYLWPWKSFTLKVLANAANPNNPYTFGPSSLIKRAQDTLQAFITQSPTNRGLYVRVWNKYGDWIDEMTNIRTRFLEADKQRKCMAQPAKDLVASGRIERNEMRVSPTLDVSNGNIILEPYIRVEDYDVSKVPNLQSHIDYVKSRQATSEGVFMGTSLDVGQERHQTNSAQMMLQGVVNIDLWDQYMKLAFGPESAISQVDFEFPPLESTTEQTLLEEDCGDDLPNRADDFREKFEAGTIIPDKHQLRDFFKSIHFGLRVSYLAKPGAWTDPGVAVSNNQEAFSHDLRDTAGDGSPKWNSEKEKTYHMVENLTPSARNIYLTPLTSVEVPINMFTEINDLFPEEGFHIITPGTLAQQVCGEAPPPSPADVRTSIGYFRHAFGEEKTNLRGDLVPLSSPRNALQKQLAQTDEYAFLFRYAFSLDRMLSLTNLYSATYLSSLPDMNNLFAPTKENLMYIFINSLNSGKWANACQTGNKDLLDALLNGIDVPWASMIIMVLKFPLKIFKAYMEQTDMNIAISKNIQKVIKMLNAIIANAQRQMNAMQKAGAAAGAAIGDLAEWEGGEADCGFGLHSPESTHKPPNEWFKEIDETFLYEPESWMIGLALLPWTIFAPWLWGPAITMPVTGPMYWILDDSHINWLDAIIDDWISDMWKDKDNLPKQIIDGECEIDYGVEFGLASDAKADLLGLTPANRSIEYAGDEMGARIDKAGVPVGTPPGSTSGQGGSGNSGGGTGGGSSY